MSLRAVYFDLFGTVVHFAPRVPGRESQATGRSAMHWLQEALERELPDVAFAHFVAALQQVSAELECQRPPEYFEVPSRERFHRAVLRVSGDSEHAAAVAERLSSAHMA